MHTPALALLINPYQQVVLEKPTDTRITKRRRGYQSTLSNAPWSKNDEFVFTHLRVRSTVDEETAMLLRSTLIIWVAVAIISMSAIRWSHNLTYLKDCLMFEIEIFVPPDKESMLFASILFTISTLFPHFAAQIYTTGVRTSHPVFYSLAFVLLFLTLTEWGA